MNHLRLVSALLFITGALCLCSCENNMATVAVITAPDQTPLLVEENANINYSDSGRTKLILHAPLIESFGGNDPVDSFKKGMKIDFYDDSMNVISHVSANKGVMHDNKNKQLMEADNDVVVVNKKGEQLNTEQLFWDATKHKIYTNKFVKITTATQILMGDGLQSNEDFTDYKITNITGSVMINNSKKE
ncbi:MAG TPA: LPS export ABC transporter periplasmic protein LptC [Bacteroidia bacterium]|jgi:LPS export ABC transporter protein LptC|nr:LPS export ABC transporter periplasmic protein LptC [Bacteroidia bacterium]